MFVIKLNIQCTFQELSKNKQRSESKLILKHLKWFAEQYPVCVAFRSANMALISLQHIPVQHAVFKPRRTVEQNKWICPHTFVCLIWTQLKALLKSISWKATADWTLCSIRAVYPGPFECMSELAPSISLQKQHRTYFPLHLCDNASVVPITCVC